jgi:hypothetical protein
MPWKAEKKIVPIFRARFSSDETHSQNFSSLTCFNLHAIDRIHIFLYFRNMERKLLILSGKIIIRIPNILDIFLLTFIVPK